MWRIWLIGRVQRSAADKKRKAWVATQAFTSGVLAERARLTPFRMTARDAQVFCIRWAERAAWCRTCGNQFAAGAAENFWSVYRADEYAVTAPSSARIRLSMSHSVAHGVNTNPRRKGDWITVITSARTALARPPA